jgi:hypothetical protein
VVISGFDRKPSDGLAVIGVKHEVVGSAMNPSNPAASYAVGRKRHSRK